MKTATLTAIIQRDLLRTERLKTDASECHTCGRSFMPRPSSRDDNTWRFCSTRCREAYDAGFPAYDPSYVRKLTDVSLAAWWVVAGPSSVEIGSQYYAPIIEAAERKRRRLTRSKVSEELIRPRKLCQRCGAKLPVWVNGKHVRSDRKYCTGCSPNTRSGTRGRSGGLTAKKVA
jgi:hypothetical protein